MRGGESETRGSGHRNRNKKRKCRAPVGPKVRQQTRFSIFVPSFHSLPCVHVCEYGIEAHRLVGDIVVRRPRLSASGTDLTIRARAGEQPACPCVKNRENRGSLPSSSDRCSKTGGEGIHTQQDIRRIRSSLFSHFLRLRFLFYFFLRFPH